MPLTDVSPGVKPIDRPHGTGSAAFCLSLISGDSSLVTHFTSDVAQHQAVPVLLGLVLCQLSAGPGSVGSVGDVCARRSRVALGQVLRRDPLGCGSLASRPSRRQLAPAQSSGEHQALSRGSPRRVPPDTHNSTTGRYDGMAIPAAVVALNLLAIAERN